MEQPARKRTDRNRRTGQERTASTTREVVAGRGPPIASKWARHYAALLKVRERLLKDRGEQLAESGERLEPYSMDIADSASNVSEHDLALARLSAEQEALYEVDQALKRIETGTYGVCEETGQPIPAARLKAIPWTRFVLEVERRLEDKGVLNHARLGKLRSVREPESANLAPTAEELETLEVKMENTRRVIKEETRRQERAEQERRQRP